MSRMSKASRLLTAASSCHWRFGCRVGCAPCLAVKGQNGLQRRAAFGLKIRRKERELLTRSELCGPLEVKVALVDTGNRRERDAVDAIVRVDQSLA